MIQLNRYIDLASVKSVKYILKEKNTYKHFRLIGSLLSPVKKPFYVEIILLCLNKQSFKQVGILAAEFA